MDSQAEQGDDAEDLGTEDLQDTGDYVSKTAYQDPAATCAYCHHDFGSGDQRHVINGRLYLDGDCAEYGEPIAIAAE